MELSGDYALLYMRDYNEIIFPVKDMEHAITLANAIADSDLLNDYIDFNCFDLGVYDKTSGTIKESWTTEEFEDFNDYLRFRISERNGA